MSVPKGTNNFKQYQTVAIEANAKLIEAELKDIRGRAGVNFEDLDALVRYVAKVTNIHRTTLKRNTTYRKILREHLSRQQGATSLVKLDDATPELLRAIVEDKDLIISNQAHQLKVLQARLSVLDAGSKGLPAPVPVPKLVVTSNGSDAAFQDTAFALIQLIQHINLTAGVETFLIDEEAGVIMDAAILNPRKRREMAIGPERTKSFIAWYKANKEMFDI